MRETNTKKHSIDKNISISRTEYDNLLAIRDSYKHRLTETIETEAKRITKRELDNLAYEATRNQFYENDKFNPMLLLEFLIGNTIQDYFVTPMNDQGGDVIWKYNEILGIYENTGIPWVKELVQELLGNDCRKNKQSEVVEQIKVKTYKAPREFEEIPRIVVLNNGSFNIHTGELEPHNPLYYAKSRIPITYDPEATCPNFKKFLKEVIPNSVNFYQEWLGYHLLKDYRFQRCVVCLGDGDNGKSTLLRIQTSFLGTENIATQSLYRLSTNRFAPAELYRKTANIAADIGPDELRHTGTIKMLTGGDYISAEHKNRDPFSFKNYAKLTFSCNQLPKTPDQTLAFFKRFIVLMFNDPIPKDKQDPNLLEKLTTQEELSGIFNFAYDGLKRALERKSLDEPGDTLERKELYLAMSDPVTGFVNEYIVEEWNSFELKQDLINAFFSYCKKKGFIPKSDRKFYEEFKKTVYVRDYHPKLYSAEYPNGKQVACYKGVKLLKKSRCKFFKSKNDYLASLGSQTRLEDIEKNENIDHPHTR